MKTKLFIYLYIVVAVSLNSTAQTVTKYLANGEVILNAVLVDTTSVQGIDPKIKPFYIDIFEASCKEKYDRFGNDISCFKTSESEEVNQIYQILDPVKNLNHPAIFSFEQASYFCNRKGGRIPTNEEWNLAAFNLNRNKNSTHFTDKPLNIEGDVYGNFGQDKLKWVPITDNPMSGEDYKISFLKETDDLSQLSIESIGTLGMTGNSVEIINSNNSTYCGFGSNGMGIDINSQLKSKNLCNPYYFSNVESGLRCVYDAKPNSKVLLDSKRVKGTLKKVIDYNQDKRQKDILDYKNNGSNLGFYPPIYVNFESDIKVYSSYIIIDPSILNVDPSLEATFMEYLEKGNYSNVTPATEIPNPNAITFKETPKDWERDRLKPTIQLEKE